MCLIPVNLVFDQVDIRCCRSLDGSGKISSQELGNIFQALNIKVKKDQLDRVVSQMDSNGSGECDREDERKDWMLFSRAGQIEFEEFASVMAETYFKKYSQEELRSAFKQFDQDGSGFIQANELERILEKMGRHCTRAQIDQIIGSVDQSGDGKIAFNEFAQLFQ